MTSDPVSYLTPETLAEYFRAKTTTVQRLSTKPPSRLRIDPLAERLELFVPAEGAEPDVTAMARLNVDTVYLDGSDWFQLQVDAQGIHHEAYSVLASIVDDMSNGHSFVTATSNALRAYRDLLNQRKGLTPEQQQGMIGELLILRHARDVLGPDAALEAWLGPSAEQHDFGFSTFDVEVKTTTSEARSHLIGSENQLQPSIGRSLWLMSVQLTGAGASDSGHSLARLVDHLRTTFEGGNERFIDKLHSVGWRDADHELYLTRYILRSTPAAYLVDDEFPAITRPRLEAAVPKPEIVGDVSYRVDLTTLDATIPPEPLTGFVQEESR